MWNTWKDQSFSWRELYPHRCRQCKNIIHEKVTELGLEGRFIGGHPMAGSERSGFSNSSDHLLENAYYIITPGGEVALEKISDFTELISSLGAIPLLSLQKNMISSRQESATFLIL